MSPFGPRNTCCYDGDDPYYDNLQQSENKKKQIMDLDLSCEQITEEGEFTWVVTLIETYSPNRRDNPELTCLAPIPSVTQTPKRVETILTLSMRSPIHP